VSTLDHFLLNNRLTVFKEAKLVLRCSELSIYLRREFLACAIWRGFLSTKTSLLCLLAQWEHQRSVDFIA